jgi:hypothetical protein
MNKWNIHILTSTGVAVMAAILVCGIAPAQTHQPKPGEWAQLSPFTAVQPAADSAIVRFNGHDYELVSINGLTASTLLEFCHRTYKTWWEKRFTEDLVEVLADMGHPMAEDKTVNLALKDPASGRVMTIDRAPMTPENRKQAFQFRQDSRKDHPDWPR